MTTVRGIRDGNGREGAGERTGERTGRKKGTERTGGRRERLDSVSSRVLLVSESEARPSGEKEQGRSERRDGGGMTGKDRSRTPMRVSYFNLPELRTRGAETITGGQKRQEGGRS